MADASRYPTPPNWQEAFAALPMEAPPTSRWPAIDAARHATQATTIDGMHAQPRAMASAWPRRAAWAAVLAMLAIPAILVLRPDAPAPSRTPFANAPTRATTEPAAASTTEMMASGTDPRPAPMPDVATSEAPGPLPARSRTHTMETTPNDIRIAQSPATLERQATSQPRPWPRARIPAHGDAGASMQAALEPYYAESARLEGVIAAARDPRVGSGPAASLAGALDAELAGIDARLAQTGLDAGQRLALWRERVEVLRASAEFESQLRLLAAEGDVLDGALVRVD